jgi:hypothetical protein
MGVLWLEIICGMQLARIENFRETGVLGWDTKRRGTLGSGDGRLLLYSLILLFTTKVT